MSYPEASHDATPATEPTNTTVAITTDNGLLDDKTIAYLVALSTLTGKSTKTLGYDAVNALRESLVPTTKPRSGDPATPRAPRQPKPKG